MTVAVVGASHRTAPIEVRERLHVDDASRADFLETALERGGLLECVVLSTCNRSELYVHAASVADAERGAVEALARHSGIAADRVREHVYVVAGREAASHLFRVTAGLDSLVVGEPQIQGQVGRAYEAARDAAVDTVGPVLHRLFQTALAAGGDARSRTRVSEGAASVPSAAVQLAKKVFGSLEGRRAVVVGAGEMGELTLSALLDRGVAEAAVASRTLDRARATADRTGAVAVEYEDVWTRLGTTDILITSTAAPHPVVTVERMRELRPEARGSLVLIDIAVPRDVEAAVGDLSDVFLYNIDDLQRVVEATERDRRREREAAERVLEPSVGEFWSWYQAREAVPVIRGIRDRAERIRRRELEEALAEIDALDPDERERIHRATRLGLKKILHAPTVGLRELATEEDAERLLEVARRLFDLQDREGPEGGDVRPDAGAGAPDGPEGAEHGDDTTTDQREEPEMQDTGSGR